MRFLPPLILSVAQVDYAMDVLEQVLTGMFERTANAAQEERQVAHVA